MNYDLRPSNTLTVSTALKIVKMLHYLDSFNAFDTSDSEAKSTLRMVGGFARENPVPTVFQFSRSNTFRTCLPSKPVAPVMSAVFAMMNI